MSDVIALANFGRTPELGRIVSSMQGVQRGLPRGSILAAAEVDEGDKTKPSDHQLLADIFDGWTPVAFEGREPLLIDGGRYEVVSVKSRLTTPALRRQTPPRRIYRVMLRRAADDTLLAVIFGHYAAGAHNGDRAPDVRRMLLQGYGVMLATHRLWVARMRARGVDVLWAMDTNWRDFPRLHRREVPLTHKGPDHVRAIPGRGRRVRLIGSGVIGMKIEPGLHDCRWARVVFDEAPKRARRSVVARSHPRGDTLSP